MIRPGLLLGHFIGLERAADRHICIDNVIAAGALERQRYCLADNNVVRDRTGAVCAGMHIVGRVRGQVCGHTVLITMHVERFVYVVSRADVIVEGDFIILSQNAIDPPLVVPVVVHCGQRHEHISAAFRRREGEILAL